MRVYEWWYMTEPLIITRTGAKAMLAKYGLGANKKLGQHYLVDTHVLDKILAVAELSPECAVLEIGPGLGALTQALAGKAGHVCAVEIDMQLAEALSDFFANTPNVRIYQGDILKTNLNDILLPYKGSNIKAVANLPYYISSPAIFKLLESEIKFTSITVMVQKEVAGRMAAKPNNKDYGALTLAINYHADIYLAANVPPNCFMPRPNVDSAIVHLTPYYKPPVKADKDLLFYLIKKAFGQRRKTLVNALSAAGNIPYVYSFTKGQITAAINKTGLLENVRGEMLSLHDFSNLAELLAQM